MRDGQREKGGIRSIDLADGKLATVLDAPFRMGHVQCNPWVPGEILYCHETGGDAPQRMWLAHAGSSNTQPLQPLYKETPDEWVTHEVVVDPDHVLFILSAFKSRLRLKPSGLALINLRTQEMELIGQVPGSGFWHCSATRDLKWAVGDNMENDIYLINLASGERTLLSTGHRPNGSPVHVHPNFSPDGHRLLFNSGLLGHSHLMTIELPSASELPPRRSGLR
jgi:oligogalacturonide lyase